MNINSLRTVVPSLAAGPRPSPWGEGILTRLWKWLRSRGVAGSKEGRLHLAESTALGDKRFVAVVQVDGRRFLLGSSQGSINLLTELEAAKEFRAVLDETAALSATDQPEEQLMSTVAPREQTA